MNGELRKTYLQHYNRLKSHQPRWRSGNVPRDSQVFKSRLCCRIFLIIQIYGFSDLDGTLLAHLETI